MADAIAAMMTGIFVLLSTYYKPHFFWESTKAKWIKEKIGEKAVTRNGYILGFALMIFGILMILEEYNIISFLEKPIF
jgi:hypothetical protein